MLVPQLGADVEVMVCRPFVPLSGAEVNSPVMDEAGRPVMADFVAKGSCESTRTVIPSR
jgi:hypothetical protein